MHHNIFAGTSEYSDANANLDSGAGHSGTRRANSAGEILPRLDRAGNLANDPALRGEEDLRQQQAVPDDQVVLASDEVAVAPPLTQPPGTWAMTVTQVDLAQHHNGRVVVRLFTGVWETAPYPADDMVDGDVIIVLDPPHDTQQCRRIGVRLFQAYGGVWDLVGSWDNLGLDWPLLIAPTARAVMRLHSDLFDPSRTCLWAPEPPPKLSPLRALMTKVLRRGYSCLL